jgi:AraC-like DNA-binding protein
MRLVFPATVSRSAQPSYPESANVVHVTGRSASLRPPAAGRPLTRLHKIDTSRLSSRVRPRIKPRGLPPALEPHLVWDTRDPAEAASFGHELLGQHRVAVIDSRPQDFYASYHAVRLRELTLGYLDYTAEVQVDAEAMPTACLVMTPMSGQSHITTGGRTTQATAVMAVLPHAGRSMRLHCERQSAHLMVRIEQRPLLAHLNRILGRALDTPLEFDREFDLASSHAGRWNFAIQIVHAELLEVDSLLHDGVGMGQLEEFVMSSLLYAHGSNYSPFLTRPGQSVEHRATRAAKDFIEMHLAEPLTVRAIATAAGVSERTLQSAFQAEIGRSPMSYVRARRLERAHADLADAAPSDYVSVTAIASRWGFGHLGRFAAEYRHHFGESPSATLRG